MKYFLIFFFFIFNLNADDQFDRVVPGLIIIKNGEFYTDEGRIPLGCFSEFVIPMNGDDIISSIFLNRTMGGRGCIDSNKHSVTDDGFIISYDDEGNEIKQKEKDLYDLKILQAFNDEIYQIRFHKAGEYPSKMIISFGKQKYLNKDAFFEIISVTKIGDVPESE